MNQRFPPSLRSLCVSQIIMLHCHSHTLSPYLFPPSHRNRDRYLIRPQKPTNLSSLSALRSSKPHQWLALAESPQPATTTATTSTRTPEEEEGGPIELPLSSYPTIFATSDEPSSLQVATSVLLTGAISVFLFRSLRRRAKRAKELKFRSSGAKKTLKEEALDSLKTMGSAPVDAKKPPSPVQALLGGISAGVIALILYKFTITIEASLNRQTISDNFSVRQITITVRTIVNGLCYLATFVFGINAVGLILYSAQLAINSFMEGASSGEETESNGIGQLDSTSASPKDSVELNHSEGDQSSDETQ